MVASNCLKGKFAEPLVSNGLIPFGDVVYDALIGNLTSRAPPEPLLLVFTFRPPVCGWPLLAFSCCYAAAVACSMLLCCAAAALSAAALSVAALSTAAAHLSAAFFCLSDAVFLLGFKQGSWWIARRTPRTSFHLNSTDSTVCSSNDATAYNLPLSSISKMRRICLPLVIPLLVYYSFAFPMTFYGRKKFSKAQNSIEEFSLQKELPAPLFNPGRMGDAAYDAVSKVANMIVDNSDEFRDKKLPISRALRKILRDMQELDTVVGRTPQLSLSELLILGTTVVVTAASPYLVSVKVTELLVPAMAAVSAAIGISAEYVRCSIFTIVGESGQVGKVAVANGKEISALAIQGCAYLISYLK